MTLTLHSINQGISSDNFYQRILLAGANQALSTHDICVLLPHSIRPSTPRASPRTSQSPEIWTGTSLLPAKWVCASACPFQSSPSFPSILLSNRVFSEPSPILYSLTSPQCSTHCRVNYCPWAVNPSKRVQFSTLYADFPFTKELTRIPLRSRNKFRSTQARPELQCWGSTAFGNSVHPTMPLEDRSQCSVLSAALCFFPNNTKNIFSN